MLESQFLIVVNYTVYCTFSLIIEFDSKAKSHLTIGNKWSEIAQSFGLTQDPLDGNFMLVMHKYDINLRNYLQQNHNHITWKQKIVIISDIIDALYFIHKENSIHRDLHSGNILYNQYSDAWRVSDLGFCGPADKPLNSIYGNLPYIAPEVIAGKATTFASDIYSIGMLMWEISSGVPPFASFDHDYDLAMKIINGMRPKIIPGTPLKYRKLMEQCWNADPTKRPNVDFLYNEMNIIKSLYYQSENEDKINNDVNNLQLNANINNDCNSINSLVRNFNSKIYKFEDLPEPRNAIKGNI